MVSLRELPELEATQQELANGPDQGRRARRYVAERCAELSSRWQVLADRLTAAQLPPGSSPAPLRDNAIASVRQRVPAAIFITEAVRTNDKNSLMLARLSASKARDEENKMASLSRALY